MNKEESIRQGYEVKWCKVSADKKRIYGWRLKGAGVVDGKPTVPADYLVEENGIGLWDAFALENAKKRRIDFNLYSDAVAVCKCETDSTCQAIIRPEL